MIECKFCTYESLDADDFHEIDGVQVCADCYDNSDEDTVDMEHEHECSGCGFCLTEGY